MSTPLSFNDQIWHGVINQSIINHLFIRPMVHTKEEEIYIIKRRNKSNKSNSTHTA